MLGFHFLNVGHGDSTVIEHTDSNGGRYFGLVDSNKRRGETAPALRKLQQLGAERLSFVVLTHPHADHYRGMLEVLDAYRGAIDHVFTFPFDRDTKRLRRWAESYSRMVEATENLGLLDEVEELLSIFRRFNDLGDAWEPLANFGAVLAVAGWDDVKIDLVLPPSSVKGEFFSNIDLGKSALKQDRDNSLSLALRFCYGGRIVVLGGDGTYSNWMFVRKRTPKVKGQEFGALGADVGHLPHHGSKQDSGPLVLDYMFGVGAPSEDGVTTQMQKLAVISADGRSHPAPTVLEALHERGIRPYCTNLSRVCSGAIPQASVSSNTVEDVLLRFVNSTAEPTARPPACQGEINMSIERSGAIGLSRQFETACAYRNELPFL